MFVSNFSTETSQAVVAPAVLSNRVKEQMLPFDKLMREFGIKLPKGSEAKAEEQLYAIVLKYGGKSRMRDGVRIFSENSTYQALHDAAWDGDLPPELQGVFEEAGFPEPGGGKDHGPPKLTGAVEQIAAKAVELRLLTPKMAAELLEKKFLDPKDQIKLSNPSALFTQLTGTYQLVETDSCQLGKQMFYFYTWGDVLRAYRRMLARVKAQRPDRDS